MNPAFWDSSSLVPLCIRQKTTPMVQQLTTRFSMEVWWAAPVEIAGAFARLIRTNQLTSTQNVQAQIRLDRLRQDWHEVLPSEELRQRAERLVDRFPLKSADALQLAAAWMWCQGHPRNRTLISGDVQLLEAGRRLGFTAIEA